MNYVATIRELEEKRDFYNAAIRALQKIARAEQGQPAKGDGRGNRTPRTPEQRARMADAQRARHARQRAEREAADSSQVSVN